MSLLPAHSRSVNIFFLPLYFSLQTLAPLKRSPHYADKICDSQQLGIPSWNQKEQLREREKPESLLSQIWGKD